MSTNGPAKAAAASQPQADFDGWAEYYDLVTGDRAAMAAFYCSLVGDGTRAVLDLACGTGAITAALAQRLAERGAATGPNRIVGVDESAEMLRLARSKVAEPRRIGRPSALQLVPHLQGMGQMDGIHLDFDKQLVDRAAPLPREAQRVVMRVDAVLHQRFRNIAGALGQKGIEGQHDVLGGQVIGRVSKL